MLSAEYPSNGTFCPFVCGVDKRRQLLTSIRLYGSSDRKTKKPKKTSTWLSQCYNVS